MWYYKCDSELAANLRTSHPFCALMKWDYKEGFIFPRVKE